MIRGLSRVFFGAVHYGDTESKSAAVERARSLAIPGAQQVAILNVDVLNVELNSPVRIGATELDQSFRRAGASSGVGEEFPEGRLIEALVDHERHHFHMVCLCQGENAGIELTEYDSKTVHRVDLGAEDRDLIDVPEEALIGVFFVDVVKEPLECLCVRPFDWECDGEHCDCTRPSVEPAKQHSSSAIACESHVRKFSEN